MADHFGVNAGRARANPRQEVKYGDWGGRGRGTYDEIDTTQSQPAIDDVLYMGVLPPSSRWMGGRLLSSGHTGATVDIGYAGAPTAFGTGVDISSAGVVAIDGALGWINNTGRQLDIILTVKGAALGSNAKALALAAEYKQD